MEKIKEILLRGYFFIFNYSINIIIINIKIFRNLIKYLSFNKTMYFLEII